MLMSGSGSVSSARTIPVWTQTMARPERRIISSCARMATKALSARPDDALIQPVFLFQLARQVRVGEVAEILVGEGVELILQPAAQHALDLVLPVLLLEPTVLCQLLGPRDVLVVELDAHGARQGV